MTNDAAPKTTKGLMKRYVPMNKGLQKQYVPKTLQKLPAKPTSPMMQRYVKPIRAKYTNPKLV